MSSTPALLCSNKVRDFACEASEGFACPHLYVVLFSFYTCITTTKSRQAILVRSGRALVENLLLGCAHSLVVERSCLHMLSSTHSACFAASCLHSWIGEFLVNSPGSFGVQNMLPYLGTTSIYPHLPPVCHRQSCVSAVPA